MIVAKRVATGKLVATLLRKMGGWAMTSNAILVNDLLENLDEEDYKIALSFLQYLSDMRKKKKAQESKDFLSQIQVMFKEDKGWDSEESMLADMAAFRRELVSPYRCNFNRR